MDRRTRRDRCAAVPAPRLSPTEAGLLILVVALLLGVALLSAAPKATDVRTTTIRVGVGDSLWEIAQRHPVDGLTTGQTVDLLAELNGLERATIVAGTSLRVPARPSSGALAMR